MAVLSASPPRQRPDSPRGRRSRKASGLFWVAIAPAMLLFGIFTVFPMAQVVRYSFFNFDGFTGVARFVGLRNYGRAFTDPLLAEATRHTVVYAFFFIVVQVVLALLVAVLLSRRIRFVGAYRAVFFVPIVISPVAVAFTWSFLLDPNTGAVNTVLRRLGLGGLAQDWLGDYTLALYSVIAVDIWESIGFSIVLLLAGLTTIPQEVNEAAKIDGAGFWSGLRHITLPLLRPTLGLVVVLAVNGSLRAFDTVYLMTQGGPGTASELYMTVTFNQAFVSNRFGYAAALSMFVLIALVGIAYLQDRLNTADSEVKG